MSPTIVTLEPHGRRPRVTIAATLLPLVVYVDSISEELRVVRCHDLACSSHDTWGLGFTALEHDLAIGVDGRPILAFGDGTNLGVLQCEDAECSSASGVQTIESGGAATSIAIRANGRPYVTHWSSGAVRLVDCGDSECRAGNRTKQLVANAGSSTSLMVSPEGFPTVSLVVQSPTTVQTIRCHDDFCGSTSVGSLVGGANEAPAITSGVDGMPLIAARRSGTLVGVRCTNEDCDAGDSTSAGSGANPAITTAMNGRPIIAFYDTNGRDLTVFSFGMAGSVGSTVVAKIDTTGDVGQYPSITVGPDERPIIAYEHSGSTSIKLARCGNAYCYANWRPR